jgi:HAE1 family hydrophobic/amphiphilic exporter-1
VNRLVALSLRRPVTVAAACVLVVALAAASWVRLPVALMPDLQYPALVVWTAYPDVPPSRVEEAVTEPVEEAVAGAGGVQEVTSRSRLGGSLVRLRFGWNADLDLALFEAREALDRLGSTLPERADRPVVLRLDPSDRPVMTVALRADSVAQEVPSAPSDSAQAVGTAPMQDRPLQSEQRLVDEDPDAERLIQLGEVGREVVARRLEQLDGVARVRAGGGYEREVRVRLRPNRMERYALSTREVAGALRRANVALPGGTIRRGPFRYAVEVSGEFASPEEVAAAVVARRGGAAIHLRDVADVRLATQQRRGLVRLGGRETILLQVERAAGANVVRTAERVRTALGELREQLQGVRLDVVTDESRFVEAAIGGVAQAVLWGGLLAVLVLLFFLRRLRALGAVALAVPLSLGAALVLFDLLDVSLNLISLSGLALGVGMLVDNAIVVTENVARFQDEGLPAGAAARKGAQEVAGPIAASTLTTVAVFLPLTFVEGLAGRLFRDQSLAVVASLSASLGVALTVVPLIAARHSTGADDHDDEEAASPSPQRLRAWKITAAYERTLRWALDHRRVVVATTAAFLVGAALLAMSLPREVVPEANRSRVEARLSLAPGAGLDLVTRRVAAVERTVEQRGLATRVLSDLGAPGEARLQLDPRPSYEGDLTLLLPDSLSASTVAARVRALDGPGEATLDAHPARTQLEALLSSGPADLFIDLAGVRRAEADEDVAERVVSALQKRAELTGVRRAAAGAVPAYRLHLKRETMARFGVGPETIAAHLETAAGGRRATELRRVGKEVPITLRARAVGSVEALLATRIPVGEGLLPLSRFVEAEETRIPAALTRAGQAPVVRLRADAALGRGLAEAEQAAEAVLARVLPEAVRGTVRGANEDFRRSLRAVGWSLALSVLLVYLILAAQFESLRRPLVVLATVPLALGGAALTLFLASQSLNLMSLTGSVVLVGIVVNDAIIKVDLISQRRQAGQPLREAILTAGRDRLRPILMTTVTTALGLLPLALGIGPGAALRAPLAIAVVGGLVLATLWTLLVVPVLYAGFGAR